MNKIIAMIYNLWRNYFNYSFWYSWPLWLMVLLFFANWLFFYTDIIVLVTGIVMFVFFNCLVIQVIYLLTRKDLKKFVSFLLLPFILFSILAVITPEMIHFRHYIEFIIQKNIFNPEIGSEKNGTQKKRWMVKENAVSTFWIVFDPTDEILRKSMNTEWLRIRVDKVGEHFYMVEENSNGKNSICKKAAQLVRSFLFVISISHMYRELIE